jgi:hypothetical protein
MQDYFGEINVTADYADILSEAHLTSSALLLWQPFDGNLNALKSSVTKFIFLKHPL